MRKIKYKLTVNNYLNTNTYYTNNIYSINLKNLIMLNIFK